jgi:hypothetical protein
MRPFDFKSPISPSERMAFLRLRIRQYREELARMEQEFKALEKKAHENSEYRSRF